FGQAAAPFATAPSRPFARGRDTSSTPAVDCTAHEQARERGFSASSVIAQKVAHSRGETCFRATLVCQRHSREPGQGRRTVAPGKICLAEREGGTNPAEFQPGCLPKGAQPLLVFLGFRAEQAPNVILESILAQRGTRAQESSLAESHPVTGTDPTRRGASIAEHAPRP